MDAQGPSSAAGPLEWMDVGPPPASVTDWSARMDRLLGNVTGSIVGVMTGVLAGVAGVGITGGSVGAPLTWNFELFFALGIPVGLAFFFLVRWAAPRSTRARYLSVRRVAIDGKVLRLDMDSGEVRQWRLNDIWIAKNSPAAGWFVVSARGQGFLAPPTVASEIRNAAAR
jgi:hypothetical protein